MTVLTRSCFLVIIVISTLLSTVDAEPCRSEGSLLVCQVGSDSYHQNPNESLEYISTLTAEDNTKEDVQIDINIPHIHLNKEMSFKNLHSLTISGDSDSYTIINCTHSISSAGIIIDNVRNLTVKRLVLIHCGSEIHIRQNKTYNSALTVRSCGNTTVTNTVIIESRGIGLTILEHQNGTVHIAWSNFIRNAIPDTDNILGGGGIYIGKFRQKYSNGSFKFECCIFEQNVAHTRHYYSFYTNEFGEEKTGDGQGGGIFIAFESNIDSHVSVLITDCKFIKNRAFLGGGLSGRGGEKLTITKVSVAIENSLFESNGCDNTTNTSFGGGLHLSYHWINSTGCEYKLWNVNFTNNCAEFGGGAFFYSDRRSSGENLLLFDSCTFEKNKAHIGSAIDMASRSFMLMRQSTNLATVPVFKDCSFLENKVFINSESQEAQRTAAAGIGTVYASQCDVTFEGDNCFENNLGTAVYMINGVADFSNSSATFDSNRGIRGGAIALLGTSYMIVGPNREYMFCNNSAVYQGGAIFNQMIDTHDFTLSRNCFIQYYDNNNQWHSSTARYWNASITFYGNSAQVGNAIFTTSLNPCLFINNNTDRSPFYITVSVLDVFASRGIEINESEVATEGARLQSEQSKLQPIPGKRFEHRVKIMDDTQRNASEPLRVNIGSGNTTVKLDSTQSLYVGEKIQLKGKPGDMADLSLQTVSTRQSYITLSIEIANCPPGFKLENFECVCNSKEHYGLLECDRDFHSVLSPGLWIGNISDEKTGKIELVTSVCPRTFCDYNDIFADEKTIVSVVKLPLNLSDLERTICGMRRQGILCGLCTPGYTTHYHSPDFQCKSVHHTLCKVGWLFYILSELVPVTVVFITVIAFNISFTSGAVNGFILFSQILLSLNIDASGIIRFPRQKEVTQGYQFLYGFLNLDFFTIDWLSFCLWPKATALDMLAFKYITIVYALSLVILVIWFMNRCGGGALDSGGGSPQLSHLSFTASQHS